MFYFKFFLLFFLLLFLFVILKTANISINNVSKPINNVNMAISKVNKPTIELWFNYPLINPNKPGFVLKKDFINETKLIDMINAAAPNSNIYFSIYLFTREIVSESLIKAAIEKNISIQIIVEDGRKSISARQKKLVQHIQDTRDADGNTLINIIRCNLGCNGSVINHNKFFLFSKVGIDENIVVQSSANLEDGAGSYYENSVVIKNDKKLYDGYLNYWMDLASRKKNSNYFHSIEGNGYPADGSLKVYFMPQKFGDKILEILSEVTCNKGNTSIFTTVSNWDSERGIDVFLNTMAKQGCWVGAIIPDNLKKTDCKVRANLQPNVEVYTSYKLPHSKYLIVDGYFKGKKTKIVWTGSHNYNYPSLRLVDETLLEIRDKKVVSEFKKNWYEIKSNSLREKYPLKEKDSSNSCYNIQPFYESLKQNYYKLRNFF